MILDLVKIFAPTVLAFFAGLFITPLATHFFFRHKMWRKHSRSESGTNGEFKKIHNGNEELKTPRIGGVIIWISALGVTSLFYLIAVIFPGPVTQKLNFLGRSQTVVPFFTLFLGSILGLWDDLIQIFDKGRFARDSITWRKWKAILVAAIALLIGCWFYYKLGMVSIHIPFGGNIYLGIFIIPVFIIVALAVFSGGVIDGIDGLSGGVFASIFAAYAVISYANNQINLAAFSAVITGAILAFLWFNIPPARFYMGETGIMGLTIVLATIAFLTNSVLILPIIILPLVLTSGSVILQMLSTKFRHGKKMFKVAPLHHHFEALGWPSYKVTMRFWVFSVVFAILGVILQVIGK